jgi:hypothetical protein
MKSGLIWQNTLIWLGLFVFGFVNGTLREVGIKRLITEPYAHHLSVVTAIVIFSLYMWGIWNRTRIHTPAEALGIGVYWFILTAITEIFILNRWIAKLSWDEILETYNLAHAQLWPLVLIWIGILPWLMRRWKGPAAG